MSTTRKVTLGAALLSAATALPAAAQMQATGPVEVPLEVRGGRMVVPIQGADGTALTFLASTGAAVTVLSQSAASRIGDQEIFLGGLPLNLEDRATAPDAELTYDGFTVDGMVGNNTLNNFDLLFDIPGGRLVLKPFGRTVEWPGTALSEPIRLRVYHGVVIGLDVEVNGTGYPAMLELGAPSLLVNQSVLDESGVAGETADLLRLGPSTFSDVPIRLSDNPVIDRFSPNGAGFVIVGAPIVWDCAVSVSWVHREMRTCVR